MRAHPRPLAPIALLACVLCGAFGCESQARPPFLVQLIDGQGVNPVPDLEANLTVTVLQAGQDEVSRTTPIIDGTFQLDVPIVGFDVNTALSARIAPVGDGELIGATVAFGPYGRPSVQIVMGTPGTCVPLTAPRLDGARISPGLALVRADLFAIGGERSGSTVRDVEVFAAPHLGTDLFSGQVDPLEDSGFGRTRLARLDDVLLLAIDGTHAIVYDAGATSAGSARDERITLHGGAGSLSAIAPLGDEGVAVIGGGSGDDPAPNITIVRSLGEPDRGRMLAYARAGASAQRFGRGILVAGGQADGEPLFEWISLDGTVDNVEFGEGLPPRTGGALVVSPGGASAFYYLGQDRDGNLPSETYLITGCPAACLATPADPAERPRFEPAIAPRVAASVVLGGYDADGVSASLEEVRFVGSSVTVVPLGDLSSARGDTVAVTLGGGTVLVAGGRGLSSPLDTMELCFPQELEPLSVPGG